MSDLKPQDLGNGFTLSFQKRTSMFAGSDDQVRAVVKDASGTVVVRGPVVNELDAEVFSRQAAMEFLMSAPGVHELYDEEDEKDEKEDDDD